MIAGGPDGEVVVGVVVRPWGIKGQFVLDPLGSDPEGLISRGSLRLRSAGKSRGEFKIIKSHRAGGRPVVQVEGCSTVEEAETFRGAEVVLRNDEFEPAPPGSFYPHELIGLEVTLRGGEAIGIVERVEQTGGPELLIVRSGAQEILIPFAEAICTRIDTSRGRMEIDPPDGLLTLNPQSNRLEPCDSRS